MRFRHLAVLTFVGGIMGPLPHAEADVITVTGAHNYLDARAANSLGIMTGTLFSIGAAAVPNGLAGTTAAGTTVNLSTGALVVRNVGFVGNTVGPDLFARSIPYDLDLTGSWTLTFTNGADTTSVTTPDITGAVAPPFAGSVTISGSSSNPTFSWTYPAGSVDGVTVLIRDFSRTNAAGFPDTVFARNFPGTTNSFTVPDVLAGGLSLEFGNAYSLEIQGVKTRDPGLPISNPNRLAVSRAFFDFTPLPAGSPVVNLPAVDEAGVYHFDLLIGDAGETVFIDPLVAIGYEYAIGLGDPNFASVLLPDVGDGEYDLFACGGEPIGSAFAGVLFEFLPGGLGCFRVLGIEVSAGLDPTNTTAFITGLAFTSGGTFTGTMTPITVEVSVPEPASLLLMVAGLALVARRRVVSAKAARRPFDRRSAMRDDELTRPTGRGTPQHAPRTL
jgi:hypothetical protein